MTELRFLLLQFLLVTTNCENVGWKKYFAEETSEFHDIPLTWEDPTPVPDWLSGTYVRNGPAQISFGSERRVLTSWLDGFAKLHSFKFSGSQVLFSGKMLESPNYLASVAAGELQPMVTLNGFSNPEEEWTWWEKMKILVNSLLLTAFDNNNPALWRIGKDNLDEGVYLAVTDAPVPLRFNISDLSTIGMEFPNAWPATLSGCAHWIREVGTDNSINFQRKKGLTGPVYVEVQRYRPEDDYANPQVVATFVPKKLSSIHSFSITENYAVFFFYPVIIDGKRMFETGFHVFDLLTWLENEQTDVFVVNLKTGNVTQFETKPTYSAHHANAYENGENELIVDISPTPYINLRDYLALENQLNPPEVSTGVFTTDEEEFERYTIDLANEKIKSEHFPNTIKNKFVNNFDFPTINEDYRGLPYCIVYGWSAMDYSRMALVKKNICDSTKDLVFYIEDHYSSEMHFLANPTKTAEDDGVLVTIVFDGTKEKSYLLILDAKTLQPVNKAYLPHNIPWSAHGMHFPEANFQIGKENIKNKPKKQMKKLEL
eukprot:GFUD01080056.1.p1 GENE.GFUD01080056.1~~GFUD01080056.1.p1  ORF type:complete len:543 (+),score=150.85 GFUD01080056.1:194-1822(+)